jgi:hypothetical protein
MTPASPEEIRPRLREIEMATIPLGKKEM